MNAPFYMSEATWRSEMLAAQASTRQAIRELGFLIAGLFLAYVLSEFWPGLAVVIAAVMCGGAIYTIWRENRAHAHFVESMTLGSELER